MTTGTKPRTILAPDPASAIPEELQRCPRWLSWRWVERDGKWTKPPVNPNTGRSADKTNPNDWSAFGVALGRLEVGDVDGLGVVFTGDGLAGIDLDDCIDADGNIAEWARQIITELDSYTEISPSGSGVKVFLRGELPPGPRRRGKIEAYDRGWYFTVTGAAIPGTRKTIEHRDLSAFHRKHLAPATNGRLTDDDLLQLAQKARNGAKFSRLWAGDASEYDGDRSRADQALADMLAFWFGRDAAAIDRLFRQSALFRPKWDEVHYSDGRTYGEETTAKAVDQCTETYRKPRGTRLGDRLPHEEAERAREQAPECPDPTLRAKIFGTLLGDGLNPKPPSALRRADAGAMLLAWLAEHGGFVQSELGTEAFYFHGDSHQLFGLESTRWSAFLYALSGANPAGTDFAYLLADTKAKALDAPRRRIMRMAHWDDEQRVLRVSRFDGTVYRLDGDQITEEGNGEGALFEDDPSWLPYTPDYEWPGQLHWLTSELPNWATVTENLEEPIHGLAFRAWLVAAFLSELCPTRPILVKLGEKGSGKSMTLRVMLRYLFGPAGELSAVPDKPDGFTAAAAATHILALDNLDEFVGWIRDKLARLSTGGIDHYRRLYTSNELGTVRYRTWVALTARTPDSLRRDDLADRLLLLPVKRIEEANLTAERQFLTDVLVWRDAFWGDLLTTLNKMVAGIRDGRLRSRSTLRLADWESIGRLLAQIEEREDTWDMFVDDLKKAQAAFLLEGDLIGEGLELWLQKADNAGREVTTRELHRELSDLLFPDGKTPADWPKRVRGFGMRLAGIRRDLRTRFRVIWAETRGRKMIYQFWPIDGAE